MNHTRRNLARPGLSYMDANRGRLVSVDDDVLDIKRQIEEIYGLKVHFDVVDEVWVVVQTDYNGVESLVTTTDRLDQTLLDTIRNADQTQKGFDAEKQVDDWNAAIDRQKTREMEDRLGEFVEKLRFAFRKDGLYNHCSVGNSVGSKIDQRRVTRARAI